MLSKKRKKPEKSSVAEQEAEPFESTFQADQIFWAVLPLGSERLNLSTSDWQKCMSFYSPICKRVCQEDVPTGLPLPHERLFAIRGCTFLSHPDILTGMLPTWKATLSSGEVRHVLFDDRSRILGPEDARWPTGWRPAKISTEERPLLKWLREGPGHLSRAQWRARPREPMAIKAAPVRKIKAATVEHDAEGVPPLPLNRGFEQSHPTIDKMLAEIKSYLDAGQRPPATFVVPGRLDANPVGTPRLLLHPDCPKETWKAFFASPYDVLTPRTRWTLVGSFKVNALEAVCRVATKGRRGWFERLQWIFEVGTKVEVRPQKTNPLHYLASAKRSDLELRKQAMELVAQNCVAGTAPGGQPGVDRPKPVNPWVITDGGDATPLMRAIYGGDGAMAMWLLEKAPAAAWINVKSGAGNGSLAAAAAEHLPAREGMALIERSMELAPGSVLPEDLEFAYRQCALNREATQWKVALKDWADIKRAATLGKAKSSYIVPEVGVSIHQLRSGARAQEKEENRRRASGAKKFR